MNLDPLENGGEERAKARAEQLIEEFRTHLTGFVEAHPEHARMKREIFEAWAIQKIAELQLSVDSLVQQLKGDEEGAGRR